jgi:hypothetical protein
VRSTGGVRKGARGGRASRDERVVERWNVGVAGARALGRSITSLLMRSLPRKKATKEEVDQLRQYLDSLSDEDDPKSDR